MSITAWLSRFGIIFDLLAFLFSAPELIGEKRLLKLEIVVKNILKKYVSYPIWRRRIVTSSLMLIIIILLLIWASSLNLEKILFNALAIIWLCYFLFLGFMGYTKGTSWVTRWFSDININNDKDDSEDGNDIYDLLALVLILFPPLAVVEMIIEKGLLFMGNRLLPELAKSKGLRRRSFYFSVFLFVIGVTLQLLGTM